ncbi:MAG: Ger(x)C family spore germination protein [Firmicutes bacterium]|nr:Ger(x)C family spore germination protein [Bacillota bacterium]
MSPKRLALLLILALLVGCLSCGCWNRREPELLGVVLAVGFDYNPESDLYTAIAQLANPIAMGEGSGESGGGGSNKTSFWTTAAEGHTPFEAIRNLVETSSRELLWSHCRVLLFSEKLARRGIGDVLDLFERGRQFRLIIKPAVVKGALRDIMEADFPLEETGALGLDRMVMTIQFEKAIFPEKNLSEPISTLSQTGKEMIIGRVEVLGGGKVEEEPGGADSGSPVRIGGSAVFRGDRMVGWADNKQTQGWAYATGRAARSYFVVKSPVKEDSYVSIGVFGHRARMSLHGNAKDWRIELRVKMHGRIQEFDGPGNLDDNTALLHSLERRAAATARNRIEAALSRAQELKSDIFGFGNLIYRKNPELWEKIAPRWDDEIFPQLKIDLSVEFRILRSGLIVDPL